MNYLVLISLGAVACGSVKQSNSPDALPQIDAPTPTRTAIAADAISPFTAPNAMFVRVPFTSVTYDDSHELALNTGRFTATRRGDYQVCASLMGGQTVTFELDLFVNGIREKAIAFGTFVASGCRTTRLSSQDFVEVWVHQASGAPQLFENNPFEDWLTIEEESAQVAVISRSAFSVPSSVFTKVPYSTEGYDDRNEFDPTTSQFTASQDGDYQVCASLSVIAGLSFELDLFKNNVRERAIAFGTGAATGCRVIQLASGDQVTVQMIQVPVTTATIPVDAPWDWFTVRRVMADTSIGNTTTFSIPISTFVTVPYASELYDVRDSFDPATHRYTAETPGDYEVCASLFIPNSTEFIELNLVKSSVRDKAIALRAYAPGGCRVTRISVGDTIEIQAYSLSATAISVDSNSSWNWFTVRAIR
jgi:hypothetical protein